MSTSKFNSVMSQQFKIVDPDSACLPPKVASGSIDIVQYTLFPREPHDCARASGFVEISITVAVDSAVSSAERFATVFESSQGHACYAAINDISSFKFWVTPERVTTVAAVDNTVTVAIVNQALLNRGSAMERRFVQSFDKDLLGDCQARLN